MSGTEEDVVASDDEALYVLTAVLLTPANFPSVLGDDYPEACAALDLDPVADGYGLVLGQDSEGARWTVVVDDVSLVAVAIASWDCGMEYDLSPDDRSVVAALPGWPLAVAVAAPGVPAPHDPDPDVAGGPPLSPPDTSTWGPAQRRLGADEIALQWAVWRDRIDDADFVTPGKDRVPAGEAGSPTGPAPSESPGPAQEQETEPVREAGPAEDAAPVGAEGVSESDGPGKKGDVGAESGAPEDAPGGKNAEESGQNPESRPEGAGGVQRVLAEVRAYLETPPPLGRVRSSFASGEARTLRADGPGWSMVARTDDIAFVLLDDMPGEVLPVGRGPELPGLLASLDKMAVRPA